MLRFAISTTRAPPSHRPDPTWIQKHLFHCIIFFT
jgi:hypothetical protein